MANTTDQAAPETPPVADTKAAIQFRLARRELAETSITLVAFLVIYGAFGLWTNGVFFSVSARLLDIHSSVPVLLLGLATLVTLMAGQFDLSVAGIATASTYAVVGLTIKQHLPFYAVIIIALGVGVIVGLINGILIQRFKVNAFIATFATGATVAGLSDVYSGDTFIGAGTSGTQLPKWFVAFGSEAHKVPSWIIWIGIVAVFVTLFFGLDRVRPPAWAQSRWLTVKVAVMIVIAAVLVFVLRIQEWAKGVSWLILFLIVIGLLLGVLIRHTTFGRHVQAIGSNPAAARLAGVKVQREVVKTYILGGVIAATAGIILAATQGSATPELASPLLLPAFSAAFLSTVVLSDGRFTVAGTILGGIFVTWVGVGLVTGGVNPNWVNVINGIVLIAAVAISTAIRARR
jgi:ribose/xylose/arabinose/galactoside ABC-type transport system permease subunit